MKKLIVFLFIISICSIAFAVNKNIIYDKDTKEIIAVKISERPATEQGKVDIVCKGNTVKYGVNPAKVLTISVDEKSIPDDVSIKYYKIDVITKDIYEPITIEYISGYKIKNIKEEIIGRLTYSSGTTYNIYDMKGTKLGTYKASVKLTTINIKGKEYKLIKIGTSYTIKE
jgi:hypothetical protein